MKSSNNPQAVSPHHTIIAQFLREHGIKGEIKALPLSRSLFLLKPDDTVVVFSGRELRATLTVAGIRQAGRVAIVSFDEISGRDAAISLRGCSLAIKTEMLPELPNGEYYCDQIIGLSVRTMQGEPIGTVTDIFPTGSNDVYVVRRLGRQYLVPAIRDVIREINLAGGYLLIEPMDGLFD